MVFMRGFSQSFCQLEQINKFADEFWKFVSIQLNKWVMTPNNFLWNYTMPFFIQSYGKNGKNGIIYDFLADTSDFRH